MSGKDGFIITMKKLGDTTIIIKNLGDSQYNATELSLDYKVYEPLSSTKCEIISPVPDPITRAQLEYKLAVHKSRYANDRESQATYEAKCDIVNSNISGWTSMENLFKDNEEFDSNISNWDTSSVTNMKGLFYNSNFRSDISGWDTSKVTDMSYMFYGAKGSHISTMDVSNVTNMESMFENARWFDTSISNWDVKNVTNMKNMFKDAVRFDRSR